MDILSSWVEIENPNTALRDPVAAAIDVSISDRAIALTFGPSPEVDALLKGYRFREADIFVEVEFRAQMYSSTARLLPIQESHVGTTIDAEQIEQGWIQAASLPVSSDNVAKSVQVVAELNGANQCVVHAPGQIEVSSDLVGTCLIVLAKYRPIVPSEDRIEFMCVSLLVRENGVLFFRQFPQCAFREKNPVSDRTIYLEYDPELIEAKQLQTQC
jgi:hypothetical protein